MHPLFRTQAAGQQQQDPHEQDTRKKDGAGTMMGRASPRTSGAGGGRAGRPPASFGRSSPDDSYESDTNNDDGDESDSYSESYELATADGTNTQYETDSSNSRDGWGSGSGSSHENDDDISDNDDNGDGSGSEGSGSNGSGSRSEIEGSHGQSDDEDEEDDNFWNRYGSGAKRGNGDDDDDDDDDEKGWRTKAGKKDRGNDDQTKEDDFDDEFGFGDAFPSISSKPLAASAKHRKRNSAQGKRLSCPGGQRGRCALGKFKRRALIGVVVTIISVAAIILLYMFVGKKDNEATSEAEASLTEPPSAPVPAPSQAPGASQAPGEVEETLIFWGFVTNGVEEGFTMETLEDDLTAALNNLAPQILEEVKQDSNVSMAEAQGGDGQEITVRRNLEASSANVSVSVDLVELACPTVQLDEDGFLCIEISAFIVFTVDDRTVDDVNCSEAMETAIEDGRLQGSLVYVGSNASVLFFFGEELPPDFLAPSNETNSTAEPGSDDSTTMDPTSDATTVSPSQQSSARQSSAPSAAPSLTSGPEEPTQTPEGSSSCVDTSTLCADWAAREPSECERNRDYMALTCPKSCDACDEQTQSPSAGNETGTMSPSPTASPSSSDSTNTSDFFPTSSPSNFTDEDTPAPSSNFTDDDTPAPSSSSSLSCSDSREECPKWAEAGECTGNPGFMLKNCQKACGECDGADGEAVCDDDREECPAWADVGECENNPKFMLENCKKTCGQCQSNDDAGSTCQDVRDECPEWADVGECENNPKFMLENCQQSCGACP